MVSVRSWFTGARLLAVIVALALSTGSTLAWQPDFKGSEDDDTQDSDQPGLISETEYESPQYNVGITWTDAWKVGDPDHPDVDYAIGGNYDGPVASDPDLGDIIFLQDADTETSVLSLGFSPAEEVADPELIADAMNQESFLTDNLFLSEDAEVVMVDSNETTAAIVAREAAPNDDHIVYMQIVGDPGREDYSFWVGLDLYDPAEYENILTSIEDDIEVEDNEVFDVFSADEILNAVDASYFADVQTELDNYLEESDRFNELWSQLTSGDLTDDEESEAIDEVTEIVTGWTEYADTAAELGNAPAGFEDVQAAYEDFADAVTAQGEAFNEWVSNLDQADAEDAWTTATEDAQAAAADLQDALDEAGGSEYGEVLYQDDFDDPDASNMSTESWDPDVARYSFSDGAYVIEKIDPDADGTIASYVSGSYGDVAVAIDAWLVGDTEGRYVYVTCRDDPGTEGTTEYRLVVEPDDGDVTLTRWVNNDQTNLAVDQRADVIQPGNAINRLELRCIGTEISGYVNGVEVVRVEDDVLQEGAVGFGTGLYTDSPPGTIEARFDNLLVGSPASEEETLEATEEPTATTNDLRVNLELVLDSSGSMAEQFEPGVPRIDVAKDVPNDLIAAIADPSQVNLGIRVFGHEGDNTEAGRIQSCDSTELLVPFGNVDTELASDALSDYAPAGWTPISHALEEAGADFEAPGERELNAIILVTDGLETCNGDPCEIAAALAGGESRIVTHVIGMGLDEEEKRVLQCIADAGGGLNIRVESIEDLDAALQAILGEMGLISDASHSLVAPDTAGQAYSPETGASRQPRPRQHRTRGTQYYRRWHDPAKREPLELARPTWLNVCRKAGVPRMWQARQGPPSQT